MGSIFQVSLWPLYECIRWVYMHFFLLSSNFKCHCLLFSTIIYGTSWKVLQVQFRRKSVLHWLYLNTARIQRKRPAIHHHISLSMVSIQSWAWRNTMRIFLLESLWFLPLLWLTMVLCPFSSSTSLLLSQCPESVSEGWWYSPPPHPPGSLAEVNSGHFSNAHTPLSC